jgi:hypothetical protein
MLPKTWHNEVSLDHACTLAEAFVKSILETACSDTVLPPRQTSVMVPQMNVALCTLGWSIECDKIEEKRLITKDWLNKQTKAHNVSVGPSAKKILLDALRKYMTLVFKHVGAPSEPIEYTSKQILHMLLGAEAEPVPVEPAEDINACMYTSEDEEFGME